MECVTRCDLIGMAIILGITIVIFILLWLFINPNGCDSRQSGRGF